MAFGIISAGLARVRGRGEMHVGRSVLGCKVESFLLDVNGDDTLGTEGFGGSHGPILSAPRDGFTQLAYMSPMGPAPKTATFFAGRISATKLTAWTATASGSIVAPSSSDMFYRQPLSRTDQRQLDSRQAV